MSSSPFDAIVKSFVQQYYSLFDDPSQRSALATMYNHETSFMSFEGFQVQGTVKIMEKLNSLTFQKINRAVTSIDSQPMVDGGILISVLGRLQCDEDPPHPFNQVFVLKTIGHSIYCAHDIFRLGIHDTM